LEEKEIDLSISWYTLEREGGLIWLGLCSIASFVISCVNTSSSICIVVNLTKVKFSHTTS